eukprot:Pompholyxophrys_punicea_v1_NODE_1038_length_1021_cov_4.249482.p3 type:complete len:105 gc:universal NODE_1038_length_1021_cov_4.249482:645-331(-)
MNIELQPSSVSSKKRFVLSSPLQLEQVSKTQAGVKRIFAGKFITEATTGSSSNSNISVSVNQCGNPATGKICDTSGAAYLNRSESWVSAPHTRHSGTPCHRNEQ